MVDFQNIYLLFGIKFSGEQLLASILQQNPKIDFKYNSTSFSKYISLLQNQKKINISDLPAFTEGVFNLPEKKDSQIIIDHCFGWGNTDVTDHLLRNVSNNFKFIAVLGNPVHSAAFIVKNYKSANIDLQTFLNTSEQIRELKLSYVFAKKAYEKYSNIFVFDFKNSLTELKDVVKKISSFCGSENFDYDYSILDFVEDLNAEEILGEFYDDFDKLIFWDAEQEKLKPEKDLDKQLRLAIHGDFEESRKLVDKIEKEKPNNHRAAFNRGWFKMADGELFQGQLLLDRGRLEGIFGNELPRTTKPIWDGESKGKVLYILEGGFGDQIHAIRYINKVHDICGDVLISCGKELIPFLAANGHKNLIAHEAIDYSYFDYWMPSMSTITVFDYEYKNIIGEPYIEKLPKSKKIKRRIGLKWSGNPEFEHEQHRKFPAQLLFDAVKDFDVEYVSLQRDEEKDLKPEWVKSVKLNEWTDTQYEISQCDLVVSSCTSVAHLAASMGVETWIIIPVLPYYLWALPGEKTPYYDSVTLFRQTKYGDWTEPFDKLTKKLKTWI